MKRLAWVVAAVALLVAGVGQARAVMITFGGLPGNNGDPFTTPYTEGDFTVTPTMGNWFVAKAFGHPVPDIFGGPIGNPVTSSIRVTENTIGDFTFGGVDLASNNGNSTYLIQGLLNGNVVLSESGTIMSGSVFVTIPSINTSQDMDSLSIQITPGAGTTSFNLDNINVAPVPEPPTILLLSSSTLGLLVYGWRRRKLAVA